MTKTLNLRLIFFGVVSSVVLLIAARNFYGSHPQTIELPKVLCASKTVSIAGFKQTLYRGEHIEPVIAKLLKERAKTGTIIPFPGDATIIQHRDGNTRSGRSSWTIDPNCGLNYAKFGGEPDIPGFGYLFIKAFNPNSVNYTDMSYNDIYGDSEVLIKGVVEGCLVIKVTPWTTVAEVLIITKSFGL